MKGSTTPSLYELSLNYIIDNEQNFDNMSLRNCHLDDIVYRMKHKRNMQGVLGYLKLVQNNTLSTDFSVLKIQYLKGDSWDSYDHLLVKLMTSRGNIAYTFIKI